MNHVAFSIITLAFLGMTTSCTPLPAPEHIAPEASPIANTTAPVRAVAQPFTPSTAPCDDAFVAHDLDHVTTVAGDAVRLYESNGAGLAVREGERINPATLLYARFFKKGLS